MRSTRPHLPAEHPVDLGTKCTVFMSSRVRHAQKIGRETADLAAGIAYSVVKNALFRIIGAEQRATRWAPEMVVQGGAFKSDAVLRAFEKVCGVEVIAPRHRPISWGQSARRSSRASERMMRWGKPTAAWTQRRSALLTPRASLSRSAVARFSSRCPGCANACPLTVADFGNGRRFVSGNRCGKANRGSLANGGLNAPGRGKAKAGATRHAAGDGAHARPRTRSPLEQRLLERLGA